MTSRLSLVSAPQAGVQQLLWGPQPNLDMTRVHDFATDLARTRKGFKEIKEMLDQVYGDKSLKKTAIYDIIRKVKDGKNPEDQHKFNAKKTKRTEANIQSVATSIESNRRISLQKLTSIHDLTIGTVLNIIHKDLGLVKKSAR